MTFFKTAEERAAHIIKNANYFTVVRRHRVVGRGYKRHECKTLPEAEALAQEKANEDNANYMIYAVSGIHDTYVKGVTPQKVGNGTP